MAAVELMVVVDVRQEVAVAFRWRTAASAVRNGDEDGNEQGGQNAADDERDQAVGWRDDGFEEERIVEEVFVGIAVNGKNIFVNFQERIILMVHHSNDLSKVKNKNEKKNIKLTSPDKSSSSGTPTRSYSWPPDSASPQ